MSSPDCARVKRASDDVLEAAEQLMIVVRDRAIEACGALAQGRLDGPLGVRWRSLFAGGPVGVAIGEFLPDVVDQVLFQLLHGIDAGEMRFGWQRDDGAFVSVVDAGEGELSGWLMTGAGG